MRGSPRACGRGLRRPRRPPHGGGGSRTRLQRLPQRCGGARKRLQRLPHDGGGARTRLQRLPQGCGGPRKRLRPVPRQCGSQLRRLRPRPQVLAASPRGFPRIFAPERPRKPPRSRTGDVHRSAPGDPHVHPQVGGMHVDPWDRRWPRPASRRGGGVDGAKASTAGGERGGERNDEGERGPRHAERETAGPAPRQSRQRVGPRKRPVATGPRARGEKEPRARGSFHVASWATISSWKARKIDSVGHVGALARSVIAFSRSPWSTAITAAA